ncbi:MAG: hypothetical protein K6B75_09325 [Lachnospiraceae bacterium]|nr:hypothetical protein [Lachnospiraceae bacterium]
MKNNLRCGFTKREQTAIALNCVIVIFEIIALIISFMGRGLAIMVFFTQESNTLLMVSSLIYLVYKFSGKKLPKWVMFSRYVTTLLTAVTFVVVLLILVPMSIPYPGAVKHLILGGANPFMHIACPVISFISFVFYEEKYKPTFKDNVLAALPPVVYGIVTVILNYLYILDGPYPFLRVHNQPVRVSVFFFVVILGGGFLFGMIIRKLKCKR